MGQRRPVEQPRLGFLVGRHGAVVVEVVARQVGEHRDVVLHAVDAALVQADRRHLHRQRLRAGVDQPPQLALQGHRIGRGARGGGQRAAGKTAAHGADHRAAPARRGQRLRDPLADRGLAVGSGDTDAEHPLARRAVPTRSQRTQQGRQARHRAQRYTDVAAAPAFSLRQYGGCAALDGSGDVPAAVVHATGQRNEHVAAPDAPAVRLQVVGGGAGVLAQPGQHVRQRGRRHHRVSRAAASTGLGCSGPSGATCSARRLPAAICANTGAATSPP